MLALNEKAHCVVQHGPIDLNGQDSQLDFFDFLLTDLELQTEINKDHTDWDYNSGRSRLVWENHVIEHSLWTSKAHSTWTFFLLWPCCCSLLLHCSLVFFFPTRCQCRLSISWPHQETKGNYWFEDAMGQIWDQWRHHSVSSISQFWLFSQMLSHSWYTSPTLTFMKCYQLIYYISW